METGEARSTAVLEGRTLVRFHNSRALSGFMQRVIFLRKMTLEDSDFGVQQLWSRGSGRVDKKEGKRLEGC
jgi:hypothetical protein